MRSAPKRTDADMRRHVVWRAQLMPEPPGKARVYPDQETSRRLTRQVLPDRFSGRLGNKEDVLVRRPLPRLSVVFLEGQRAWRTGAGVIRMTEHIFSIVPVMRWIGERIVQVNQIEAAAHQAA